MVTSEACKHELRAPVSIFAFTFLMFSAGSPTHSRHPMTGGDLRTGRAMVKTGGSLTTIPGVRPIGRPALPGLADHENRTGRAFDDGFRDAAEGKAPEPGAPVGTENHELCVDLPRGITQ